MDAIHVLWTKPFYACGGERFAMEDFDILTAVLSALKWRQHNGRITMVTDTFGSGYLKKLGLEKIWDEIEISLDGISVNPKMFWAAGKLYALAKREAPCVMLDTDFIVWHGISFGAIKNKIAVQSIVLKAKTYMIILTFSVQNYSIIILNFSQLQKL